MELPYVFGVALDAELIVVLTILITYMSYRKIHSYLTIPFAYLVGLFSWVCYEFSTGFVNILFIPLQTLPSWGETWLFTIALSGLFICAFKYLFGINFEITSNTISFGLMSIIMFCSWWIFPQVRLGNSILFNPTWLQGFLLRLYLSLTFMSLTFGKRIPFVKNVIFEKRVIGFISAILFINVVMFIL